MSYIREVEKPTPEALYALQHEKAKHERARRAAENLENRKALMSRRAAACGRAELLASFLGGAVWGVFRENANCGDPPG